MIAQKNPFSPVRRLDWLGLWILFSCWCSASGWILSALGCLDRAGYAVALLVFLGGFVAIRKHLEILEARPCWLFRRTTYARLAPKLWLALAVAALVGGVLYHPDNYDYLTYRFPRLLHWCWEHRWHWIDTPNERQNVSAPGMEWLMAPLFIFFQTDRLFFLINVASYLFLPGLVFSVFRRLGISGRIGWWWMWVLPSGLCYSLQAGGTGNDLFAAIYFLGALHYLYQAREGKSFMPLALSLLSIALLTGSKASNIPLVLPWLVVAWNQRKYLGAVFRPGPFIFTGIVAALVSFLPMALLNIHFTGSYTGDPHNTKGLQATTPVAGVIGNSLQIAASNLSPPIWTHDISWPISSGLQSYLRVRYPRLSLRVIPFQIEETAGAGLGIVALTALYLFYGLGARWAWAGLRCRAIDGARWFALGTGVAWLGYLGKMGSEAATRLVAVYYIVGIAALLVLLPLDGLVVHRRAWRWVACAAMIMVFPLVVFSPSRPLVPTRLLALLADVGFPRSALAQLQDNYRLRAGRFDDLNVLRQNIPATETTVGSLGGSDDPGVSLWLPFGSRQVVEVNPGETSGQLEEKHIRFVAMSQVALEDLYQTTPEALARKWAMTPVQKENPLFRTRKKIETWYLMTSLPQAAPPGP